MKTYVKFLILLLSAGLLIISCKKDEEEEEEVIGHIEYVNSLILDSMKIYYLWNDQLPQNIDPGNYSDPDEFIKAVRYKPIDRFSYVMTEEEFNQYFEEGETFGFGFQPAVDQYNNFWVLFVQPTSEAAEKGVRRGWQISKIDGTTVTRNNFGGLLGENLAGIIKEFTFINENNQPVTLSLTKQVIEISTVLHYEVIERGNNKIGYLVFQNFIEKAIEELNEVFTSFKEDGINELILDMRYNGGGLSTVTSYLSGWLLGKNFSGQPFMYNEFNNLLSIYNYPVNIPSNNNGFSLDRMFFIGTGNTASASELIINGVKPYLPGSMLAGSTTYGKPVGMIGFKIEEYIALPIVVKHANKNHYGNFYNGIEPDLPAFDDITRVFGDPEELSLKVVLDYIETGVIPTLQYEKSTTGRLEYIEREGPIGHFIKAY